MRLIAPPNDSSNFAKVMSPPAFKVVVVLTVTVPEPKFKSEFEKEQWLSSMMSRLSKNGSKAAWSVEFFKTAHYEATRAGLDPQLVLALVDSLSSFSKYSISPDGARGYLHVHPAWFDLIGDGNINSLFDMRKNLRMGCSILRFYLDKENGDMFMALNHYWDSTRGRLDGSTRSGNFPNSVSKLWKSKWAFP